MDAVAYSHADKQQQRIKKVIAEPDNTSGLVTMPSTIATGETITIPAGRVVVHPNLQIDGTLDIQGDLFIPSGGTSDQLVSKSGDTMTGNLNFSGIDAQIGTSTNNALILKTNGTERLRIDTSGNVLLNGGGGLGYGTGSGGTVTQLTSKSTFVTLNKPSGRITMNAESLASNAVAVFQCVNSLVSNIDNVIVGVAAGASDYRDYNIWSYCASGSVYFYVKNISAASKAEAITLQFSIFRGATA